MIVSRNEVETSCWRAALGVKLPHGLAEDAAWIGAELIVTRPDGLDRMLRALEHVETHGVHPPAFRREGHRWILQPGTPGLAAAPAAADLRQSDPGAELATGEGEVHDIVAIGLAGPRRSVSGPIDVDDGQWRRLLDFAARSYVPATAASRARGAGPAMPDEN
jgi:hypothetical protein